MLTEIIPAYCENHMELINTLYEQNAKFLILYLVVHIITTILSSSPEYLISPTVIRLPVFHS
jgi:hypothetical protein